MTDIWVKVLVAVLGTSGIFWAFLSASRKRPQLVLHIKGHGHRSGLPGPLKCEVYFHCVIRNRSSERNSIDKLIFTIWNQRNTEYIWEAWNVEIFDYNKKLNTKGQTIDLPLVLEGKSGKECYIAIPMDEQVYFNYLADRMPSLTLLPNQEKPFKYKLMIRDSYGNHFTGGLNTDRPLIVDYKSLRHMSVKATDIKNAVSLGRPKLRHFITFYTGRARLWVRFRIRLALYYLGIVSSV